MIAVGAKWVILAIMAWTHHAAAIVQHSSQTDQPVELNRVLMIELT